MEYSTRFELAISVWRTDMLPLHQEYMARELGFEPRIAVSATLTDLESAVLPLNYSPISQPLRLGLTRAVSTRAIAVLNLTYILYQIF